MAFNGGFTTQGVPYITGSDGQLLTWSDAEQAWVPGDGLSSVITTVNTDNGIVGDGSSGNPVKLDTSISVQNLTVTNTASIAHIDTLEMQSLIVGDKYITILSGANNHTTANGAGILWGSGSVDATTGDQGSIAYALYRSGSDALELFPNVFISGTLDVAGGISTRSLPAMTASHVLYVSADGSDANIGSFNRPFATLQKANDYALATYTNQSEAVLVKILPGSYSGFNVTRRNIYFVTEYNNSIERAVTISSPVRITATGTGKYQDIYGFDGILFTAGAVSEPLLHIQGSGSSGIYVQNCQLYTNSNNVNANVIRVDGTWSQEKVLLRNSIIQANQSGADLLKVLGGDIEIDSCRFYLNSTTNTSASAISASGDTSLLIDRALIENYSSTPAVKFASARTFAISNSSITKGGTGRAFEVSSSAAIIGNSFIGSYTTIPANLPNIATNISISGSNIYYANLTSLIPTVPVTLLGALPLTEVHGTVLAASVTSSLGFSGRLYGTASYALDAGTLGGVPVSSYARRDIDNTFVGKNEFRDDVSITQEKNLVLVLDPFALKSGDIIVQGGTISNIGGDIRTEYGNIETVGGEFVGIGTGLTDLSSSNWRDGGSGPEQQFADDVRSLLSGGNNITYDSSTGVIETTINPNLYVSKVEATASLAFIHETNTFTEPQIIEVDTGGGSLLTVQHASIPNNKFIVDYSGSVGVRTNPYYDRANHDLDPFTLAVDNTIIQTNTTKGIIQRGSYGPMILRDAGSYRGTFDLGADNTYKTFGKFGMWSFPNELTFTIPDTNVRTSGDVPQQNWFKFKLANRSGPSSDLFTISNFGIALLNADLTINGNLTFNGNLNLTGDLQANSFTGSFSGSAENIYGLTGSMWTGANSFADDVRAQLNAGSGINYDPINGTIVWTGIGGSGGLLSKNNITGSGKFGEEFDLIEDITVTSVTAYLSGTAQHAEDSDQLGGIDAADYAYLHDPTVVFSGDIQAESITANVSLNGPGTGITDINSSNWTGGTPGFESDVRNQISASYPINYDPVTGEITYLGTVSVLYTNTNNIVGDGTIGLPLDLAADIAVNSVTGDLVGNADTATYANSAGYSNDSGELIGVPGISYARRNASNTFSAQNTFTAQRNTFKDIGALDITASHFVGDGINLTNLTASNIRDWHTDVAGVFQAGANVVFTKNGNYTVINSTGGGGGGGGLTTGSITGSGVLFDEIRLKPGIFVDYIDYNTASAPSPNELGRIQYDSTSEMLQYNFGNGYTVNLGQQNVIKVENNSGATISKGSLVSAVDNLSAGVPLIQLSDASNAVLAQQCIGFVLEDILDGDSGYVLTNGLLYSVDTSLYNAGDRLFLDVSAGAFTDTKPTAPNSNVIVGIVVESGVAGAIYVKISYPTGLQTLNDTDLNVIKSDGDLLVWDDANSYWKNSHSLVGDYTIDGALSASNGITASMFYADTSKTSVMRVTYADTASYTIDPGAARTGVNNDFSGINKFTNHVYFGTPNALSFREVTSSANTTFKFFGPVTASSLNTSNLTVSNLTFTGAEAVFNNNITVNGTASIAHLETRNQQSLQVGDKYITILSGSSTHVDMDGAGILFGSGSSDITTGDQDSVAHIVYRKGNAPVDYISDYIEVFPGLKVSGSLTSTNGLTITGSIECTTDISASAISASYIYGDGSSLSNINAVSSTNNILTVTTSSTYGTINPGSVVSFSGSLFCAADSLDTRRSNFVGVVLSVVGNTYTVATSGMVSASAAAPLVGGDIAYVDGAGMVTTFDNIPSGQNITQVGIASYDVGTSGNIILQPRIFGVKA